MLLKPVKVLKYNL